MPQMTGPFPTLESPAMGHPNLRPDAQGVDVDEELIPTAIVIKNIPFAVKKEQLVQLMTEMGLPLPYAFNYHFDNGIFRGLAFANFTTAEETALVIDALNHFDLSGRKLRVEYKKMLPLAERERIEREKRIKRGQLEEQHRPLPGTQLQSQSSLSSLSSHIPATSPSPVSSRPKVPGMTQLSPNRLHAGSLTLPAELDFNDPQVLNLYSQLLLFKEDPTRDSMILPHTLTPAQRRIVHTIAHHWRLAHVSKGTGDQRAVHIFRYHDGANNISPPLPEMPNPHAADPHRRALNRAATTDFSDTRSDGFYGTLGRQSSGLLGFPDSPSGLTAAHNLRSAKSYADLRSYTPSPVPSTASFPATLTNNLARFADYGLTSTGSSNPNLTSTATTLAGREDNLLVNGMNNMNLGNGFGPGGSPRSMRNAWDRENPGPIGGHRSFTSAAPGMDEQNRDRNSNQTVPSRQPRGPAPERGSGFGRQARQNGGHSGRGSDELSSQPGVEILVE
jgi:RNA recognition motif-containing protein